MAKVLLGLVACVAAFVVAESLVCNTCSFQIIGICLNSNTATCPTNNSCSAAVTTVPSISSFSGFRQLGCEANANCNKTVNATLLSTTFQTVVSCCSQADRCNSAAPSTKMTFSAVIGVAILASVLGSMPL